MMRSDILDNLTEIGSTSLNNTTNLSHIFNQTKSILII